MWLMWLLIIRETEVLLRRLIGGVLDELLIQVGKRMSVDLLWLRMLFLLHVFVKALV